MDFSFGTLPPDWDRMAPYLDKAMARIPVSAEVGVRTFFCGPESFTPDLAPVVGEAPELRNYFVAAGLNSIGILTGGGLGRAVAQWIVDGRPDIDVTGHEHRPPAPVPDHAVVPGHPHGGVARPGLRDATTRGGRCAPPAGSSSPRCTRASSSQGAYFRDVSGWEGADWYAGPGAVADPGPLTWGRPAWFDQWAAGAPRGPDRRDPHGHVVHVEVLGAGTATRPPCWTSCRPTGSPTRSAGSPTPSGSTRPAGSRPT